MYTLQISASSDGIEHKSELPIDSDLPYLLAVESSRSRSDIQIETPIDLLLTVLNDENLLQAYEAMRQSVGQGLSSCIDYTSGSENIWENAYSSTFWFDVVDKWFTGLKLDSFFDYADLCYEYITDSLDYINGLQLLSTEDCVDLNDETNANWSCYMFFISEWIAEPIGLSIFNCWLFQNYAILQLQIKVNSFVDFADLYTSLLFNLLAESLQIRNYALLMQSYLTEGQCADFQFSLANVVRIVIDFDSSNSEPLVQKMRENAKQGDTFLDQLFNGQFDKKFEAVGLIGAFIKERAASFKQRLPSQKSTSDLIHPEYQRHYVGQQSAAASVVQSLLGLLDGSLGALPEESEGYWCGKNTTSLRLTIVSTTEFFSGGQTEDGMEELYNSISHLDEVTYNCYEAFDSNLGVGDDFLTLVSIGTNLLNNVGYMYTDVLNIITQSPETVEDPYPYFVSYNVGDFVIRIFWSSDVSAGDIPGIPRKWYN